MTHIPVMCKEVESFLNIKPDGIYVDATLGDGGHSKLILEKLKNGFLIAIDRDEVSIRQAQKVLKNFKDKTKLIKSNFSEIDRLLKKINIEKINGIIFDLGLSSSQIENPQRGFSFKSDGKLDMRMGPESFLTAREVVNTYPREDLERILKDYGEEPNYRKVAHSIIEYRKKQSINTTKELADIVRKFARRKPPIDSATRTFQAIRIEVNDELNALSEALRKLPDILNKKARVIIISYHSLEDRIVKHFFKENKDDFIQITTKPVIPSTEEIIKNPRSRSAKLRAAERM